MRSSMRHVMWLAVAVCSLAACGGTTKYQCDIYDRHGGARVSTTWYDASSSDEATTQCEGEHTGFDCSCYEDN